MENKTLRNIVVFGLYLIPFVPLIVSTSMFFPFITGKNFAFRMLVEILFALWLVLALKAPEYRPRRSPILIAFSAFLFVITVADIFGMNLYRSFWSNYERMEGLISHIHYFAYFLMLISVFKTEKDWYRFFHISIGVSLIECFYGLYQLGGYAQINQGGVRVDAKFGNAIYLAVYLLFHIFLVGMYMVRYWGSRMLRGVYGAIILLQLFVLYHTATRGAILGLIAGGIVTALFVSLKREGFPRKAALGFLAGVALLIVAFLSVRNTEYVQSSPVLKRFSSFNETTIVSRLKYIWPGAIKGFTEHPVLGWGQENYNLVFNKYYDPRLYDQEQWFDRSHNVLLDWLISAGIFGLATYLALFAAAFYLLYRTREEQLSFYDRAILFGLLAGYLLQNVTVFDNLTSYMMFFAVLAYIHVRTRSSEDVVLFEQLIVTKDVVRATAGVITVSLIMIMYAANLKPILMSRTLIQAISPQSGGPAAQLDYFRKALAFNSFGRTEGREQLVVFASQKIQEQGVDDNLKREIQTLARDEILTQVDESPTDSRYRLFAGSFFKFMQFYDDALAHMQAAVENSPRKQTLLFELGVAYINKKDFEKAFETLKTAYELNPEFEEARKIYALAAIYAGQDAVATDLLVPKYGTIVLDDDRFLGAFYASKQFDKVIQIWKGRVDRDPENPRTRVALGAAYMEAKQRAKAIAEFKKAVALDPGLEQQIEEYYKSQGIRL